MQRVILVELVGLAAAIQNLNGNECQDHRACWVATELKYPGSDSAPGCRIDADCVTDHVCINHMWAYN